MQQHQANLQHVENDVYQDKVEFNVGDSIVVNNVEITFTAEGEPESTTWLPDKRIFFNGAAGVYLEVNPAGENSTTDFAVIIYEIRSS